MRIENGFRQDVAGQGGKLGGSEIESYERVQDTFPRLKEPLTKLGAQFSGGEQQMRSIGRALMTHPELIILGKAAEGLAPLIVLAIWNVISAIRASGIAPPDRGLRLPQGAGAIRPGAGAAKRPGGAAGNADKVADSAALAGYPGV